MLTAIANTSTELPEPEFKQRYACLHLIHNLIIENRKFRIILDDEVTALSHHCYFC